MITQLYNQQRLKLEDLLVDFLIVINLQIFLKTFFYVFAIYKIQEHWLYSSKIYNVLISFDFKRYIRVLYVEFLLWYLLSFFEILYMFFFSSSEKYNIRNMLQIDFKIFDFQLWRLLDVLFLCWKCIPNKHTPF